MGTSTSFGGPGGNTPLVPTWLEEESVPIGSHASPTEINPDSPPSEAPPTPPERPIIVLPPSTNRFTTPRSNLTRFLHSNGSDRSRLGRAFSQYVSQASGGHRQAARRMGASRSTGGRLLWFLRDVVERGPTEALRTLNLEALAGRPIEEVFLGLSDYVCPDGGTVDEGIARDAFVETIADLAANNITDLNALNNEQMQTVFELYATHAIEARACH